MIVPGPLLRGALLATALLGLVVAPPAGAAPAIPGAPILGGPVRVAFAEPTRDPGAPLTRSDIAASNEKVRMAYTALMAMWTAHFDGLGARFAAPQLVRYRGTVRTSCGVMPQDNAAYCPERNTIFFDEVFIAAMARHVGGELGTDGDMAAVGVIAHEVGHAVAMQLGYASRFTYANEAVADCLAGSFTRQARLDGQLDRGDLEEAFLGMALAGDSSHERIAVDESDPRRRMRAALMSHGTREQRMQNFRVGLERGPSACLAHFELN